MRENAANVAEKENSREGRSNVVFPHYNTSESNGRSLLAEKLEKKYLLGVEPDETILSDLYEDLDPIREHWYILGLWLGLTPTTLSQMQQKLINHKDCLRDVLRHWLQSDSVNRTSKVLCEALRSVTVGAELLADELEKTYCLNIGGESVAELKCDREETVSFPEELLSPETPTGEATVEHPGSRKRPAAVSQGVPSSAKKQKGNTEQQECGDIQDSVEGTKPKNLGTC